MSVKDRLTRDGCLLAVFAAGIGFALLLWDHLSLPFRNPWHVVGQLTLARYNPNNNTLRFAVLICLPVVLLVVFYALGGSLREKCFGGAGDAGMNLAEDRERSRRKLFAFLLVAIALLAALNFPNLISGAVPEPVPEFDTFHDGESLGPAMSALEGEAPYEDYVFAHGVYEDPLRAVLSFKLFGRSIASLKTLQSVDKIIAFLLFALLLFLLFKGNYLYCFTCLLLILFTQGPHIFGTPMLTTISPRDVTLFLFLVTVIVLYSFLEREKVAPWKFAVACYFFALIPIVSFAYSIDRGFYITAAFAILTVIFFGLLFRRKGLWTVWLASTALGLLTGVVILGVLFHWRFGSFLDFAILKMPRYKELMDGYVYPIWTFTGFSACLLIAANTFWLAYKALQSFREKGGKLVAAAGAFFRSYLIEIGIWLLSVFLFRSALGRSDPPHIAYSALFAYLLAAYIVLKHYLHPLLAGGLARDSGMRKVMVWTVAAVLTVLSVFYVAQVPRKHMLASNFPLGEKDSHYVPRGYSRAADYIKRKLRDGENFVTLTNEGSWYYFVDRACPLRFSSVWLAAPDFYQEEMVRDMKRGNVKFVVYGNESYFNHIDDVPNDKRLPILFKYVKANYRPHKNIDGNEIWIKKS